MPDINKNNQDLESDLLNLDDTPWEKYSKKLLELQEQRIKINDIF